MLSQFLIQEVGNMPSSRDLKRQLRLLLFVNGCVALVTSGAALVVLLIAPLGLAAVLSCTGLVAVFSFVLGVGADLWLWHGLNPRIKRRAATELNDWPMPEGRIGLAPSKCSEELPMRRNP
jgi:hypothetical protein